MSAKGRAAIVLAASIALGPVDGLAASLETDVSVNIPSIISLYCYDRVSVKREQIDISVTRPGDNLSDDAVGTPGNWEVATANPNTLPYNRLNITGIRSVLDPTRLAIDGVCAFRALAGSAGVQVTITPLNTFLEGPSGASITLSDLAARDRATGGAYNTSYTVDTASGAPTDLHVIDVEMDLNYSRPLYYGTYSSVADGTFSITVIANP